MSFSDVCVTFLAKSLVHSDMEMKTPDYKLRETEALTETLTSVFPLSPYFLNTLLAQACQILFLDHLSKERN